MAELLVFHGGNPWSTFRKAIGVAEEMKEKYDDRLELQTFTTDSKEAEPYHFVISSTNFLFEKELVPVGIVTDKDKAKKNRVFVILNGER